MSKTDEICLIIFLVCLLKSRLIVKLFFIDKIKFINIISSYRFYNYVCIMKNINNLLRSSFSEYLESIWWNTENLAKMVDRFSLNIFSIFVEWVKDVKNRWLTSEKFVFCNKVSVLLKKQTKTEYFKNWTYNFLQQLFLNFVKYYNENEYEVNDLYYECRKENLLWLLEKPRRKKINKWHKFLQNDEWINWDKFRSYIRSLYFQLDEKELVQLYELFSYYASECWKLSKLNKENKTGKKIDYFEVVFTWMCRKLDELWITADIMKIKSLFWKYLNFVSQLNKRKIEVLSEKNAKSKNVVSNTKNWIISSIANDKNDELYEKAEINDDQVNEREKENISMTDEWDIVVPDYFNHPDCDEELGQ